MTSPKRGLLFSIALLTALALGAPSGALAGAGLDASSPVVQPDGVLVAQTGGTTTEGRPGGLSGSEEPRPTGDVKIPNVVGKHINAGGQVLLNAGLDPVIGRTVITSNSGLDRKVESQSPRANQTVPAGTRVTMTVYQFKPKVPNVVGKSQAEAERLLRAERLKPQVGGVVTTTDSTQAGKVASQVPEAGKTVPKGTTVALKMLIHMAPPGGGGPPPGWHPPGLGGGSRPSRVNTPHVIGMPQAEAERVLRDAGFGSRVRSLVATRDQSRDGRVRFQQPPPGMPVIGGTTVALDVYKLQDVRTPNVVGMSKTRAMEELRNASLIHRFEHINTGDSNKDGIVDAQTPIAGRMVPPGTSVVLRAWLYTGVRGVTITGTPHTQQSLVKVPRVEGMPVKNAVVRLSQVSLKSKTFDIATGDSNKHGMVGAQVPKEGNMVAPGTEVRLGVWWYQAGSGRPSKVNTPGVIGMPKERAVRALTDAGFGSRVKQVLTGTKNRDGRVKAQAPSPGTPVNLGTTVALDVWEFREGVIDIAGTGSITAALLPNVIGMTKENAKKTLREKGFTNVVVEDKYATEGFGRQASKVEAQDPQAGGMEDTGRRIDLTVLKKVTFELVKVPRVTNLKLEEAKNRLGHAKLNYQIRWVDVTEQQRDHLVNRQSPRPSSLFSPGVRAGTVVRLDVLKYIPPIRVPDLVGMKFQEAQRVLEKKGLRIAVPIKHPTDDIKKRGVVTALLPRQGIYLKVGDIVPRGEIVAVSAYAWKFSYPDVKGMTLAEAIRRLENVGLLRQNISVVRKDRIMDRTRDGRVKSQSPDAGKNASIIDKVSLVLWEWPYDYVPDLRNKTFNNAKATLKSLNLTPKLAGYVDIDDSSKECKVMGTSPSAGGAVAKRGTVNLTVWRYSKEAGGIDGGNRMTLFGTEPGPTGIKPCPSE